jgi:3-deoxy-7-phosphoheptulonate synthase
MNKKWDLKTWQNFSIKQQPKYDNQEKLKNILDKLSKKEALVSFEKIAKLSTILFNLSSNDLIIQAGDCAEPINDDVTHLIKRTNKLYNVIRENIKHHNIISIPRLAGQFAKPRSEEFLELEGKIIHNYRGDLINNYNLINGNRSPDPKNLLAGYNHIKKIRKKYNKSNYFFAHEALHLKFEHSLIRTDFNKHYASTSEFLWIGNRTRFIDSAHIYLLSGVINPIGVKVDHKITFEEIDHLVSNLNYYNNFGKLSFIVRFGLNNIYELEKIVKYCKQKNYQILWICDPMHGNTKDNSYAKYRLVSDIISETKLCMEILDNHNLKLNGIHLEATADDVVECIDEIDQTQKYHSLCDPRLNLEQTVRLLKALNL